MFKLIFFLFICRLCGLSNGSPAREKYEDIDVDEILQSKRLLENYVNCLLNRGRCFPQAMELKTKLPNHLKTGCRDCTEKERFTVDRTINFVKKNRPDLWLELKEEYDPEGVYEKMYLENSE